MDLLLWIFERFKEPLPSVIWTSTIVLIFSAMSNKISYLLVGKIESQLSVRGRGFDSHFKGRYFAKWVSLIEFVVCMVCAILFLRQYFADYKIWTDSLESWLSSFVPVFPEWWTILIALGNIVSWLYLIFKYHLNPKTKIEFAHRGIKIDRTFFLWREISSITFEPNKVRIRLLSDLIVYDCDTDRQTLMALRDSFSKKVKMDYTSFLA